jgi:outer membrane protein
MTYQTNFKNLEKLRKAFSFLAACFILSPCLANAYTIHDAVISAHENNYELLAVYATLQREKVEKPIALTGFLPTVSASSSFAKNTVKSSATKRMLLQNNALNPNTAQHKLIVNQPLYDGGETIANIKVANNTVDAAYSGFKDASNQISLKTIKSYEELLTARNIYDLNVKNEQAFLEHYKFAKIRFEHGEVTKTDVLLAQSKYSQAVANREQAEGDIKSAEATFERLIGKGLPKDMEEIKVGDVALPKNLDELLGISSKNNPGLLAAQYKANAADYKINVATSNLLPSVSAQAQFNRSDNNKNSINNSDGNTYLINVGIPIINDGGADFLKVKRSQYDAQRVKYEFQDVERQVKEKAITAWSTYKTSSAVIKSRKDGLKAAQEALAGVMEEYKVGTKTTLDVLDAETQVFQTNVNLRNAERDYVVAIYTILQLMGYIDAVDVADLNPQVS